jgi:hypothetical protein
MYCLPEGSITDSQGHNTHWKFLRCHSELAILATDQCDIHERDKSVHSQRENVVQLARCFNIKDVLHIPSLAEQTNYKPHVESAAHLLPVSYN